jgi:hypothetical protein
MVEILVIIFLIIVLIWLAVLSYYTYRAHRGYSILVRENEKGDLADFIGKIIGKLEMNRVSIEELKKGLEELHFKTLLNVQKVGILRYNPFENTGGDQSFVMAILDGKDNGVVLSSLHTRGLTRWFAKNVVGGKGEDFELSKEELEAIKKASVLRLKK